MKAVSLRILSVIFLLAAAPVLLVPAAATAHSTKGRLKVPLAKGIVGVDDVAYFVESYVHRELYKEKYEKSKTRFYVREFTGVDQQNDIAEIRFIVLDAKGNTTFTDSMRISRDEDGVWRYRPQQGAASLEVYTYVPKWRHYYEHYIFPASGAGIFLALVALFCLRYKKRRRTEASCET
jgi:hypothetical protein